MGLFNKNKRAIESKEVEAEEEDEEESNNYEVEEIQCNNCGELLENEDGYNSFDIPKGITIGKFCENKICQNCGCPIM